MTNACTEPLNAALLASEIFHPDNNTRGPS